MMADVYLRTRRYRLGHLNWERASRDPARGVRDESTWDECPGGSAVCEGEPVLPMINMLVI